MSTASQLSTTASNLSEKRYVTIVVRVVLDRREPLVRGEIVDVDGNRQGRFLGWQELIHAMDNYLAKQQR